MPPPALYDKQGRRARKTTKKERARGATGKKSRRGEAQPRFAPVELRDVFLTAEDLRSAVARYEHHDR